ncbi:GAD-like domain-containing protein [Fulvimarina sp. MAC8]|uniref:GAD-like domain-containing protein n=1 Tax=Fulvimarina sp. MAC8 TaxID=3162874 RepID=UPI0032EE23D2
MSAQDFLDSHGLPRDAYKVEESRLTEYRGRVPDDLIDLWREVGFGAYIDRKYWFCEPSMFDPYFSEILSYFEDLHHSNFAAFGYSCLGVVDLWHKSHRHYTFDLSTGLLLDLTSLRETAEPPYNVEELMALVGVPEEQARETFLASRSRPQDIWVSLESAVDAEGYRMIFTDSGKQLIRELRSAYGNLQSGEVYIRRNDFANEPESYERIALKNAFTVRPSNVRYIRYSKVDGRQQPIEEIFSVR